MDLKNTYLHARGTSVKVQGHVYEIDPKGIAHGVAPEHARRLMKDKVAWKMYRQPAEAEPEPEAEQKPKVPTEPMVEVPAPMPGPGPELIPSGAAEAAFEPAPLPVEAPKPAPLPEPSSSYKRGPGRPKGR
jgi:hypothetical protein